MGMSHVGAFGWDEVLLVAQAGLGHMGSRDSPASVSQVAGS
jgi:hypothetical protein